MSRRRGIGILFAAAALLSLPLLARSRKDDRSDGQKLSAADGKETPAGSEQRKMESAAGKRGGIPAAGKTVRVAIRLTTPPMTKAGFRLRNAASDPEAQAYQERLKAEQAQLAERIEERLGHPIEVVRCMTMSANVISANVPRADIETIRQTEGVAGVSEETLHEPTGGMARR